MPPDIEDAVEDRWQFCLDQPEPWTPLFTHLATLKSPDLLAALTAAGLLTSEQQTCVGGLRRSAENRAVQIPGSHRSGDEMITLLVLQPHFP
jgi:hypothetical protein